MACYNQFIIWILNAWTVLLIKGISVGNFVDIKKNGEYALILFIVVL